MSTEGPRPYYITADDHGGFLVVAAWLTMTYSVLFFGIRLYLRTKVNGPFGRDDIWLTVGTVLGIVHSGMILGSVNVDGFGKSRAKLTASQLLNVMKSQHRRQEVLAAWDITTEIFLLVMPLVLVWRLQMRMAPKIAVAVAFSVRAGVIIIEVYRLKYIYNFLKTGDMVVDATMTSILSQLEIHYGLMAATMPCMKPFMQAFDTGYLGNNITQGYFSSSDGYARPGQTYAMNTMSSAIRGKDTSNSNWRPDHPEFSANIRASLSHERPDSGQSTTSSGSDKMIIRKTEGWTVRYDGTEEQGPSQRSV
ncbi:MAG: Ubiquinone biosynthesis protein coq9, mitochondrial [Cirrosporium novae-zelandiae]|nr:MAG: Ubiquinone biosynthesis protein coq9, mitochondrial [Cirrosporium novae-zelandiae]KAI9735589.1 MAG: Ubiquinone biosynthesis protein coq9, mitochondrial [Cirrosporium novae-zelandiae]